MDTRRTGGLAHRSSTGHGRSHDTRMELTQRKLADGRLISD
jgi:hypothetical protein